MDWENKRRDRVQGVVIEAEPGKLVEIDGGNGVVELPSLQGWMRRTWSRRTSAISCE
jgi:translation initiation factor IF-1